MNILEDQSLTPFIPDELRNAVTPVEECVTYIYEPKTADAKKVVLQGNIPADLNIFFHVLRNDRERFSQYTNDIPEKIWWNYDKNKPQIWFWLRRNIKK